MTRPSSPCIRLCILDLETGLCEGCGRSRDEIARWLDLPEAERLRIIAELDRRLKRTATIRGGEPEP